MNENHSKEHRPPRRVYIATTGGASGIGPIKHRPNAHSSFVSLIDSFQPMHWSEQYDVFVRNLLPQAIPIQGPYSMMVAESLDFGRSWELPVLIAHLLAHHNTPGPHIWATGRLDADLTPVSADDYELPRKIEESRALLQSLGANGLAIMPPPTTARERTRIVAALDEIGCRYAFPKSLTETRACLGLPAPGSARPLSRRWPAVAFASAILALVAALVAVNTDKIQSLFSTMWVDNTVPDTERILTITGLYAQGRQECLSQIQQKVDLETRLARSGKGKDGLLLETSTGLCHIRFQNVSGSEMTLAVDSNLAKLAVMGEAQFESVQIIPDRKFVQLWLRNAPPSGDIPIWVNGRPLTLTFE